MTRIVIEEDHFLKIIPVVLDPSTPQPHRRAVAAFFAHDEPDFLGWCARLQQRLPGLYPAEVVFASDETDLAGKSASNVDVVQIERLMVDTIRAFEPRILPGTLRVRAVQSGETTGQHNAIAFIVEGDLHAHPVPERLYLRTELDLEAGTVNVTEQASEQARAS